MSEIPDLEAIKQHVVETERLFPEVWTGTATQDLIALLAYVAQLEEALREIGGWLRHVPEECPFCGRNIFDWIDHADSCQFHALLPAFDEANQRGPG